MILILPPRHHLLEFSDGVQLAFENVPSCPCSSAARGWYPAFLSSQAGYIANERVACPSQQAVSLPASRVIGFVAVGFVSLPSSQGKNLVGVGAVSPLPSQATNFLGADIATSVAQAQDT